MHELKSFRVVSMDKDGTGLPDVRINNRELKLVSFKHSQYRITRGNRLVDSWEVSGFLPNTGNREDSLSFDIGNPFKDKSKQLRRFIYSTYRDEGWELTDPQGDLEGALLSWSKSPNHREELLHSIATKSDPIMNRKVKGDLL